MERCIYVQVTNTNILNTMIIMIILIIVIKIRIIIIIIIIITIIIMIIRISRIIRIRIRIFAGDTRACDATDHPKRHLLTRAM